MSMFVNPMDSNLSSSCCVNGSGVSWACASCPVVANNVAPKAISNGFILRIG
ncbi:MAG: hypothetical protein UW03_C0028G0011 [Candidatus Peregrinibacteria bacterium GW2011_GWA2_43_8]|nr:MAG: hypothetical protein UW03_C0028G0011 [Candidatus Peregrinibacteria bacterium GW2011_GWA2_43_8]